MALTQIDDRGLKTPIDLLDNEKIRLGTGNDLEIYHDGSGNSILQDDNNLYIKGNSVYIQANQSESSAAFKYNGAVELYYNAVKKFETTSTGVDIHGNCTITGNFRGNDDIKLNLGSSDDLQIYHSSDNLIDSYGQNVKIRNRNTDGGVTENMITMSPNGAVGLFHDGIKTCQTDANGIQVLGPEGSDAYLKLYADEGDDNDDCWRIVASSAGNFHIQNASSGSYENNIVADGGGAVQLYHNNVEMFYTSASGCHIGRPSAAAHLHFLDGGIARFGSSNDLEIWHDSSSNKSIIKETGSGSFDIQGNWVQILNEAGDESKAIFKDDGAVELYYDNSKKFETTSSGCLLSDAVQLNFGTDEDGDIYHDGSQMIINNATGTLKVRSNNLQLTRTDNEVHVNCVSGSQVELYYSGNKKLETLAGGAKVNSSAAATAEFGIQAASGQNAELWLLSDAGNQYGDKVRLLQDDGVLSTQFNTAADTWEDAIKCTANGSVELYYDNVKRLSTTALGIQIEGSGPTTTIDDFTDLNAASAITIYSTNDTASSQYGITFAGADHTNDGCNAGIIANHENVTEDSETTSLNFYTSVNELIYRPLHIDNGVRIGPLGPVAAELFTVQRTNAQVAYFDHVGANDNYAVRIRHGRAASSTNATMMEFLNSSSTTVGYIASNGSATSYIESSDYRLKENEVSINDGITRVKALKPYKFNFKDNPSETRDGFFAHEVQSVVPQAINGEKDKVDSDGNPVYQGIDHSKLVPLLTAALKEAISEIETLKTKVAALEAA